MKKLDGLLIEEVHPISGSPLKRDLIKFDFVEASTVSFSDDFIIRNKYVPSSQESFELFLLSH